MEGNNSTKTKLIKAGIKLFSQYGYAATSTRMIASEAEVNLSAIAFHYSNKERLYVACLEYMLEKVKGYYAASYMEIEGTFKQDAMTPQKAYEFLEKLIDLQIEVAFAPQYKTTLALIYWENNGPGDMRPLSAAAFDRQERVMAELIQTVAPVSQSQTYQWLHHILWGTPGIHRRSDSKTAGGGVCAPLDTGGDKGKLSGYCPAADEA